MAQDEDCLVINVGGICYTTTLSTLTSFPDSKLGKLFGDGGVPPTQDKNGHFFIDRDGTMFRYILNFMRNRRLCLPSGFQEYDQLLAEADYFLLPDLEKAISSKLNPEPGPAIDKELVGKEVVLLRQEQGHGVWVVEAKAGTLSKLKSLESSPVRSTDLKSIPSVYIGPDMEAKAYDNYHLPMLLASIIQDGFELRNSLTLSVSHYMIFTKV